MLDRERNLVGERLGSFIISAPFYFISTTMNRKDQGLQHDLETDRMLDDDDDMSEDL